MDKCFAVRKSAKYKKDRRFVGLVQNRTDVLEVYRRERTKLMFCTSTKHREDQRFVRLAKKNQKNTHFLTPSQPCSSYYGCKVVSERMFCEYHHTTDVLWVRLWKILVAFFEESFLGL